MSVLYFWHLKCIEIRPTIAQNVMHKIGLFFNADLRVDKGP